MSSNLSICTGFRLFRNSNLLTAHEHVANSKIVAYLYIYLFAFVVLETVTKNLKLLMRNQKARYRGTAGDKR